MKISDRSHLHNNYYCKLSDKELELKCLAEAEVWSATEREIGLNLAARWYVLAEADGKFDAHRSKVFVVFAEVRDLKEAVVKCLMVIYDLYLNQPIWPGVVCVFSYLESDLHVLARTGKYGLLYLNFNSCEIE